MTHRLAYLVMIHRLAYLALLHRPVNLALVHRHAYLALIHRHVYIEQENCAAYLALIHRINHELLKAMFTCTNTSLCLPRFTAMLTLH
jgi:hypothetical protein